MLNLLFNVSRLIVSFSIVAGLRTNWLTKLDPNSADIVTDLQWQNCSIHLGHRNKMQNGVVKTKAKEAYASKNSVSF